MQPSSASRFSYSADVEMRKHLPSAEYFLDRLVPGRTDLRIVQFVASGNNGHVFRGTSDDLARDFACKVIPRANLRGASEGTDRWKAEIQKADRVNNATVVRFTDLREWKDAESDVDCVVLISEFVVGQSLRQFLRGNSADISIDFIVHWLESMLDLCHSMQEAQVEHGDLHLGNVLVEDRIGRLLGSRFVFRVTDFGVAEVTDGPDVKDDFHQLAHMLAELLSVVDDQECSGRDKFVFDVLRNEFVARHLVESDPTRDPLARVPRRLFERLRAVDGEYRQATAAEGVGLQSPFDYLSCEQIGEAAPLLEALYSNRFLGLEVVEGRNNVVVTGPRGCGKTTVFRSLSLDHRFRVEKAEPSELAYLGTYYRCSDLYFSFPRYVQPREEALDIPLHFLTAALLGTLLETLAAWAPRYFPQEFAAEESELARRLWAALEMDEPPIPGSDTLAAIVSRLNRERAKAKERQHFAHDPKRDIGRCYGPDVLPRVCSLLSDALPFLRARPFYFFIDDYSTPKISRDLQANLNRLLMQRSAVCFFKISTESPSSYERRDVDGKIYVEGREFDLLNLGLQYIHADLTHQLAFVEDVFRRRLKESKNTLRTSEVEVLLGSNAQMNNNAMAQDIAEGKKPELWGKETLCQLCSGDVHILIDLVGDMVTLAGGTDPVAAQSATPRIAIVHQGRAIREKGGSFLRNLSGVPKHGRHLVDIVQAFGQVATSQLRYLKHKDEAGSPPKQASRIELYDGLQLSEDAQTRLEELLRYSVFIEDTRGKSRRGNVVPRLLLRRLLLPHLQLTFSRRDSIELEREEFEMLLTSPSQFAESARLRSQEHALQYERDQVRRESQLPLSLGDRSQSDS